MKVYLVLAFLVAVGTTEARTTTPTATPSVTPLPPPPPPPPSNTATNAETNTLPPSSGPGTGGGSGGAQPPTPPPLPVWMQCLSGGPPGGSLPELFQFWCSNYVQIVPCIATRLSTQSAQSPLDRFIQLFFDPDQVASRSAELCRNFQGVSDRVQCTQQNNVSVEAWCYTRFSQGQQYVSAVRSQRAFDNDVNVYRELACQVINDTTGCLGSAMTGCDVEVKRHLLAFYAFFTNESCLADPSAEYIAPVPPPLRPVPPRDVVVTCAQRIRENLTLSRPSQNASELDHLLFGLQQNCRTFESRYNCYDEELNKITDPTFRDIWLSFTFDSNNAVRSQRQFCQAFEGGIADALTGACYNDTQPILQQCEEGYGRAVVNVQDQWIHDHLDNVGLHKAACQTSMQRAFCLRNAFKLCGEELAEAMLNSELHTLPDICLSLLPSDGDDDDDSDSTTTIPDENPDSTTRNEDDGSSMVPSDGDSSQDGMDKDDSLASCLGCNVLVVIVPGLLSLLVLV